jgi:PilZ domain-containing protein
MIQMSIGKEKFVSCEGINISKTGMLVKANYEIPSSARFYLLFEVPLEKGNYEIRCEGIAAHVKEAEDGFEIGISFSDLFEEDGKILEMYIAELAEED